MYKKKLIEVALPLEAINRASHADKGRKTGTIRNLHKWFAPMPVPALRALIFSALVDDPGDEVERARLLQLVEDLVESVVDAPRPEVMERARQEIERSNSTSSIVMDPFCGGGSTLVEAQRLGLSSVGSDLNPIPVLISRVLAEMPNRLLDRAPLHLDDQEFELHNWQGLSGFLRDVKHYGEAVYRRAQQEIGSHYPHGPDGDSVFAWWWARTVPSPDPRFQGATTPLVTSWWLTKQRGAEEWLEPLVADGSVFFRVRSNGLPPEPSKSRCLLSNDPIPFSYVREQGRAGNLGCRMLAFTTNGPSGRRNWAVDDEHVRASQGAVPADPPRNLLPEAALGFRVQGYGMTQWADLYMPRQLLALETFAKEIAGLRSAIRDDGGRQDYAIAVMSVLGLCLGKMAQLHSTLVGWGPRNGPTRALTAFGQQTISMTWDFCEVNPFGGAQGDWMQTLETELRAFSAIDPTGPPAVVRQQDARVAAKAKPANCLVMTDPPYFAAIGYADLSDYFYPWLRSALGEVLPDLFSTIGTPKLGELIANPSAHDTEDDAKQYFIEGFRYVFAALAETGSDLPILIVYANKEADGAKPGGDRVSSGWEAMLQAIVEAGLSIEATWPIHGSAAGRVRSMGSNALATYVVLVCRQRVGAPTVSRGEMVRALRKELGPAINILQSAAIAPVDLAQAVIGPGMGVFTRYERVLEADGNPMSVRSALMVIASVLDEVLHEQEGDFDEETRWALSWYEELQYSEGLSGRADSLARSRVTSIDRLIRMGVIETRAGSTRLLARRDVQLPEAIEQGVEVPVWTWAQCLATSLETDGELAAAGVLARVPNRESVRQLAYRLFTVCERKGWAEEASPYNSLVTAWPELSRLAVSTGGVMDGPGSQEAFL